MDIERIKQKKQQIEEQYGAWIADNILLGEDLYTVQPPLKNSPGKPYTGTEGVDPSVRRYVQVISDLAGQPWQNLRILDLRPREGMFAVELARHGARMAAIESCEPNRERIRLAGEVFEVHNLDLIEDDVRSLSKEKHGAFDVVICSRVLDRLEAPCLLPFMQRVGEVCRRFALVDTHFSLADKEAFVAGGHVYWGRTIPGRGAAAPVREGPAQPGLSPDTPSSFWLTRASLYNLLRHVGFTSLYECHNPMGYVFADSSLFIAVKGQRQNILNAPLLNEPEEDWPENEALSRWPDANDEIYRAKRGHEEFLTKYEQLKAECEQLRARQQQFTHLRGILREVPRATLRAIGRRLSGRRQQEG